MPKAVKRKPAKRGTKDGAKPRRTAHKVVNAADFCAAARDALRRGEPDAIGKMQWHRGAVRQHR